MTRNLNRPNPHQITDSVYEVHYDGATYHLRETWWGVDRRRESEDCEAYHGPYATSDEAVAGLERRRAL